jgi:hypothetical protein
MTLKDLLEKDFKIDLPISGGYGNSIENAIIIHRNEINDYVGTEHFILKCLGIGRRIEWIILGQELVSYGSKKVDKIKIETKQLTESEIITQIENYYFDITDCFGVKTEHRKSFDEEKVMAQIKDRIKVLEGLNDFNKRCVALLITEELFKDTKLTIEFLDVIFNDESLPLFESMMENKHKPIMDVLRIIGKRMNENRS